VVCFHRDAAERTFLPFLKVVQKDIRGAFSLFPPLPETWETALTAPEKHPLERTERAVRGTKSPRFPSQSYSLCS
jgi:hypothetical protein